jgi:hypothetical protein
MFDDMKPFQMPKPANQQKKRGGNYRPNFTIVQFAGRQAWQIHIGRSLRLQIQPIPFTLLHARAILNGKFLPGDS